MTKEYKDFTDYIVEELIEQDSLTDEEILEKISYAECLLPIDGSEEKNNFYSNFLNDIRRRYIEPENIEKAGEDDSWGKIADDILEK